jgi:hypothetical protein
MKREKLSLPEKQGKGGYLEHLRKTSSKDNRLS